MQDSNNASGAGGSSQDSGRVARSLEQLANLRRWSVEFEGTLTSLQHKLVDSERLASHHRLQFINSQEEWKLLETNLKSRLDQAEQLCAKLRRQQEDLREKETAAIERIRALEAQTKANTFEKQALENSIKKLNADLNKASLVTEQELEKRRGLEGQIRDLNESLRLAKTQYQELLGRSEHSPELVALKREIADRERVLQELKAHNERHTQYLQQLRSVYAEKIDTFKEQLVGAKKLQAELQARAQLLESECSQLKLEVKSKDLDLENARRLTAGELEKMQSLKTQLQEAKTSQKSLLDRIAKMESERLHYQLHAKSKELELEDSLRRAVPESEKIETLKAQLQESKKQEAQLQSRVLQLESERLQNQLATKSFKLELENTKRQASLESENLNKQTTLELNKMKLQYEQVISELEDHVLEAETRIKELEARLRQEKLRILKFKEQYGIHEDTKPFVEADTLKAKLRHHSIERIFPEIKSQDPTPKLELVNNAGTIPSLSKSHTK